MLHKMLTALYFLLQSYSVLDDAEAIIINEANLILEDAKTAIGNKDDLKGIFSIRSKMQAINGTQNALIELAD